MQTQPVQESTRGSISEQAAITRPPNTRVATMFYSPHAVVRVAERRIRQAHSYRPPVALAAAV